MGVNTSELVPSSPLTSSSLSRTTWFTTIKNQFHQPTSGSTLMSTARTSEISFWELRSGTTKSSQRRTRTKIRTASSATIMQSSSSTEGFNGRNTWISLPIFQIKMVWSMSLVFHRKTFTIMGDRLFNLERRTESSISRETVLSTRWIPPEVKAEAQSWSNWEKSGAWWGCTKGGSRSPPKNTE